MTYKNTKFDESPVMRSLERLAIKKGLITPDEIKKTAEIKKVSSLKPTENFEENILKLCAGLRDAGFVKQAVEIESKFFFFKKAVHLYDTHGEKGEDVINFAHPDGSHLMKNIEGDAMVETVIDRQKAILNTLSKVPTAKLGSIKKASEIIKSSSKLDNKKAINAIKILLAQDTMGNITQAYADVVNEFLNLCNQIQNQENVDEPINWLEGMLGHTVGNVINDINNNIKTIYSATLNVNTVSKIIEQVEYFIDLIAKTSAIEDSRKKFYTDKANNNIAKLKDIIAALRNEKPVSLDPTREQFNSLVKSTLSSLNEYSQTIQNPKEYGADDIKAGSDWIKSQIDDLTKLQSEAAGLAPDFPGFKEKLSKAQSIANDVKEFYETWIK